jgi:hypothetical protein
MEKKSLKEQYDSLLAPLCIRHLVVSLGFISEREAIWNFVKLGGPTPNLESGSAPGSPEVQREDARRAI